MKLIELSQGQFTTVDDGDFDWLSQWKWTAQRSQNIFYAIRHQGDQLVLMHRLINATPIGFVTDHRDGDGLNNQRHNLRTATQLQNMMNRRGKRGGTSTFKGVWFDPGQRNKNQWRAAIRLNGKLKYLGRFGNQSDAGAAYAAAAKEHFGEFARSTPGEQL